MPFQMSVFNHSEFNSGFKNLENTKRLRDDLVAKIIDEVHRSDIIERSEEFVISRALSKGYSIEYSEPGKKFKLSDNYVNTVLNRLWTPELEKALRYGLRFGMYVVRYIAIEETDGIETTYRPYVMDVEDYIIRYRQRKDGRREYGAFHRAQNLMDKPVEQSRVMIFTDCEPDGSVNSPVQKALEQIIQLREYWERNTVVDHKNAFPLHHYFIDSKQQNLIPNKMPDGGYTPFEDHFGLGPDDGSRTQYDSLQTVDLSTRFMNKMMSQQITADETNQSYGWGERYDPLNRRYMYVAKENPSLPLSVMPAGLRLEGSGPKPTFNPGFKEVIADLVHRITGDLGVPSEFVYDTGRKFASDFQLTQSVINATTDYWQHHLEAHIITFYLDLYYRDISSHVDQAFKTADQMLNLERQANPDAKLKGALSSTAKRMLEQNITITVQFASNPILQATDVEWLHDQRIISLETAQTLALDLYGLSHNHRMTPAEMEKEDKQEAKRQKMLQPDANKAAGAKPKPKTKAKPSSATKEGQTT